MPISSDLREYLRWMFCLGAWDRLASLEGDAIPKDLIPAMQGIAKAAGVAVDASAKLIASIYDENPTLVHAELYGAGRDLADKLETAMVSRN